MSYYYSMSNLWNNLRVKSPFLVEMTKTNDGYMAYWKEANIGMCGDDENSAIEGLRDCITSAFLKLKDYPDSKLGPAMKNQRAVLLEHIENG